MVLARGGLVKLTNKLLTKDRCCYKSSIALFEMKNDTLTCVLSLSSLSYQLYPVHTCNSVTELERSRFFY